jgi:DNA-binding NarL/FixJ family response regulator
MSAAYKSILIVDDNAPVRAAIRGFLERSGKCIVCGEAADGIEVVQIAREKHPRLVVMDFAMPGMNGLEAACEIKRIEPAALIVVFSLYSDAFRKFTDEPLGIDLVVSKADGAAGLLKALHPFLNHS